MLNKIEGYRFGDVSDDLRHWSERVAEILNTEIATGDIANGAVTYAKIQNAGALSVLGRAANSAGVLADISVSASSGHALRESGGVVGFGQLGSNAIQNGVVLLAKLADLAQATIIGRAAGAGTGVPVALTASEVLAILGFNLPVEVAPVTLSGTATTLATGIPSWANDIYVSLDDGSTNGTSNHVIQLGTSGGFVTTGYSGFATRIIDAGATAGGANSLGFRVTDTNAAAALTKGVLHLRRFDAANHIWVASGVFSRDSATYQAAGRVALGGALTQIRWTTQGGADTADNGSGQVKYFQ